MPSIIQYIGTLINRKLRSALFGSLLNEFPGWRKYPPKTDFKPTLKPDSKPKPRPNLKTSLEAISAVILQSNRVHILYTKLELWALHLRG